MLYEPECVDGNIYASFQHSFALIAYQFFEAYFS